MVRALTRLKKYRLAARVPVFQNFLILSADRAPMNEHQDLQVTCIFMISFRDLRKPVSPDALQLNVLKRGTVAAHLEDTN